MAREVFVNLGGADRRLRFSATRDGIALQKRCGKKPGEVVDQDILPTVDVQGPDGKMRRRPSFYYSPEAVAFALYLGLHHDDKTVTEEKVLDWMDEAIAVPNGMLVILNQLFDALMISGITGKSVDLEAVRAAMAAATGAGEPAVVEPAEKGAGEGGKGAVTPAETP